MGQNHNHGMNDVTEREMSLLNPEQVATGRKTAMMGVIGYRTDGESLTAAPRLA
jgi:hypothetical protein